MVDMYGHVLVDGYVQNKDTPVITPSLGENRKGILIVVNEAEHPFLSEANLAFLTTILSACALSLQDVAIINSHQMQAGVDDLQAQFSPKKILLLNIDAALFSLAAVDNYVVSKASTLDYLLAPSLDAIQTSQDEKRKLWAGLKQLFCL